MSRAGLVLLKIVAVCAFAGGGFVVLQSSMRAAEAAAAVGLMRLLGSHSVIAAGRTTLLVVPYSRAAFHVLITPSCSSIASVLAFGCLVPLVPSRTIAERVRAFAVATVMIVGGNIVRITASVAMGVVAGRSSLVLFHDWIGSMFTVVYTLVGYIVMLWVLLPARSDEWLTRDGEALHAR